MELKENERIDDLELNGLKIIQNKDGFCFGMDSVLLSDFAKEIKRSSTILDMGTGTGILDILLSAKTQENSRSRNTTRSSRNGAKERYIKSVTK